jgi:hypothetical protein
MCYIGSTLSVLAAAKAKGRQQHALLACNRWLD